jgi:protein-S-isoprenylcysteine O-methyltransferase Ste14
MTIAGAIVLNAVVTISLPWALIRLTERYPIATMPLGQFRWFGVLMVTVGVWFYVWSLQRLLARHTSALPGQIPSALETAGLYRRVRHPLLLGVIGILAGEALAAQSWLVLAYAFTYWAFLDRFVARYEEPSLHRAFGPAYAEYCRHVRRWWPHLR